MRILHVVSGVAPDNRFGGVTRVALALARDQHRVGDRAVLAAAAVGYRGVPLHVDGVRVVAARGFNPTPSLGLGSLVAPALLLKLVRAMRAADVVHVHLGRDFVTLTAALLARALQKTVVVQTHGMLDAPSNRLAELIDRLLTRPALLGASLALVLIEAERIEIARLTGGALPVRSFPNGVSVPPVVVPQEQRDNDVVFLARLHPRKGAVLFTRAGIALAPRFPSIRFRIFGPDEGDAAAVHAVLAEQRSRPTVSIDGPVAHHDALTHLAAAQMLVLPALHEPFGMTLLEAMAAGTPVVVHETASLSLIIRSAGAGVVFGPECGRSLDQAIGALLDPGAWRSASEAARELVVDRFGLDAVLADLHSAYLDVT